MSNEVDVRRLRELAAEIEAIALRLAKSVPGISRSIALRALDVQDLVNVAAVVNKPLLSVKETREYLGISGAMVLKLIRHGKLRTVRVGRRVLVPRAAVVLMSTKGCE